MNRNDISCENFANRCRTEDWGAYRRSDPRQNTIAVKPLLGPSRFAPNPTPQRLLKGKPMTFAVGVLSPSGVIVAADTQITRPDGTTNYVCKIQTGVTNSGSYAIAYSADDANAADSLMTDVANALQKHDPKSLANAENTIKGAMTPWARSYSAGNYPSISLIIGVFVKDKNQWNQKDIGLYICEPPSTVVQKTQSNSGGYVSAGAGQIVADPLFNILFARPVISHVRLAQISYLIYRVKKDCAGFCGGETNAVFLPFGDSAPLWIDSRNFAQAEARGRIIDEALAWTMATAIPEPNSNGRESLLRLLDEIESLKAGLQHVDFKAIGGEPIP